MTELHAPPDSLIDAYGQPILGMFNAPCRSIDLDAVPLKAGGLGMPGAWSRFRLKEWQHFCLKLPRLFATVAVVHSKFLQVSWCHVVDLDDGTDFEHERKGVRKNTHVARELWDDETYYRDGSYHLQITNALARGEHALRIQIDRKRRLPAVEASLRVPHDLDAVEPLVVMLPVGPGRAMYSHKVPLPLEGKIVVGGREHIADPADSYAILDIHKAHYPRHTWWNWATCAGHDGQGRTIGMNLTRNINAQDDRYNENALWVDGKLHLLGPARFEFNRGDLMAPWRITSTDGRADLTFTPQGERADNTRLGVVRSVFHQPYGTFSGTIRSDDGEEVAFDEIYGVCEDHDAVW